MSQTKPLSTVLVTGGAGYIGSHMVYALQQAGIQALVLDDLSSGHAALLPEDCTLIQGDIGDTALLESIFTEHSVDAVMHFAGFIQVGESVKHPSRYYDNNLAKSLRLLDQMVKHQVPYFIFSSTAAVFGEPQSIPIDSAHSKLPVNPYGHSKNMLEIVLADYDRAYGLKSTCLRYFNAAGADPQGRTGECHEPETHLIPLVLQTALGLREAITVFGRDYDTPDGACIRDYIHIADLCTAHLLALQKMQQNDQSACFNLGNGKGFSVQEVIDAAAEVTGRQIALKEGSRRAGDPARLVADASLANQVLGWQPQYADLRTIIAHAWQWEQKKSDKLKKG